MSCKDCDHRHPHCHSKCPEYAEMQKKNAERARLKELERIGKTSSIGRDKSCQEFQKYLYANRNRKLYR
jgi:hypothetical protein